MTSVRRLVAALCLLGGALVVAAGPAAAAAVAVTGTWTATGVLGGAPCAMPGQLRHVVVGEADLEPLGRATFTIDTCLATGGSYPVHGAGTFSMTTAEGTLSGTATEEIPSEGTPTSVRDDLVVTRGTGRFGGATGDLTLFGQFSDQGTTGSGTISGNLVRAPSSK